MRGSRQIRCSVVVSAAGLGGWAVCPSPKPEERVVAGEAPSSSDLSNVVPDGHSSPPRGPLLLLFLQWVRARRTEQQAIDSSHAMHPMSLDWAPGGRFDVECASISCRIGQGGAGPYPLCTLHASIRVIRSSFANNSSYRLIHHTLNQSIDQSINQSIDRHRCSPPYWIAVSNSLDRRGGARQAIPQGTGGAARKQG